MHRSAIAPPTHLISPRDPPRPDLRDGDGHGDCADDNEHDADGVRGGVEHLPEIIAEIFAETVHCCRMHF